jgi:SAM-dependent methyltransferase
MDMTSRVLSLATAYEGSRVLQVAVELGVFAALARGPRSAAQVARRLGTEERATGLLGNALVALGLLRKRGSRYELAPVSRKHLVPGRPGYLGDFVQFGARRWPDWERLGECVRTGERARITDYFQEEPDELGVLLRAMDNLAKARGDAAVVARKVTLRGRRTLLDVGAGPGSYSIELCRRYPRLTATLFDLPATLAVTREHLRGAGLEGRVRLRAGDYRRDDLGGPYDAALLFNIIHGEGEATNAALLRRIHAALAPRGLLILKDHVLDESWTSPPDGAVFALVMLLFTGGRCYSRGEIRRWLGAAGFGLLREIRPKPPMTSSVVVAERL